VVEKNVTIYTKISNVISQVEKIPKHGYNDFHKYHYVQETDLTEHLRKLLVKEGLVIIPSLEAHHRDDNLTTVDMSFAVTEISTGENIVVRWAGEAADKGDKGAYKAYTGAVKTFLMKFFMVPSGDDPERGNEEVKPKKTAPKKAVEKTTPEDVRAKLLKRVWAKSNDVFCKMSGYSREEMEKILHEYIENEFNVSSSTELSVQQMEVMLTWLDGWMLPEEG